MSTEQSRGHERHLESSTSRGGLSLEQGRRGMDSRRRVKPASSAVETVLLIFLCCILIWSPLPQGSNRPYFVSVLAALCGVALASWALAVATGYARMSHKIYALLPAAIAFGLAMTIASLQIVDLRTVDGLFGTAIANSWAHPMWTLAGDALGRELPSYVSVNPAMTQDALIKTFVYGSVFWIAFTVSRSARHAWGLLTFVAIAGALNVVIGFLQLGLGLSAGDYLTAENTGENFRFSSTLVNPNHFATFAGIAFVAALALTYETISRGIVTNRGRDIAIRTAVATLAGPALPGLASAALLFGAILTSASRSGAVAMLAGCVALAAIFFASRLGRGDKKGAGVAGWMLAAMILAGAIFAGAPLLARYDGQSVGENSRATIALTTLEAVKSSPLTGNGFGAFESYYPLYAHESSFGTVNAAHNDYLETLSDLGVIGGTALILAPAYLVLLAVRGAFRRRNGRVFGAAAAAAGVLCGVHAIFDFSLQIPAVGVLFYALLGAGVAQAWRSEDEGKGDSRMSA